MTQLRRLGGTRVLAVGLHGDGLVQGVRTLAKAGADVSAYHTGTGEAWDDAGEDAAQVASEIGKPLGRGAGVIRLVQDLNDEFICDVLAGGGSERLWEDATKHGDRFDVLLLGGWHGFVSYGVGEELVRPFVEAGGREVVVVERDDATHMLLRWVDRWCAARRGWAEVAGVLPPAADAQARGDGRTVLEALQGAGWTAVSVADAAEEARVRRLAGDFLAGRMWAPWAISDVDSGCIGVGDASISLGGSLRDSWYEHLGGDPVVDLTEFGAPLVVMGMEEAPFVVMTSPTRGRADAVRVEIDGEAFDGVQAYEVAARFSVAPPGLIRVGDPGHILGGDTVVEVEVEVEPGEWLFEIAPGRRGAFRLRRELYNSPQSAAWTIAESLDWDTKARASQVRTCLIERDSRSLLIAMKDGASYGARVTQDLDAVPDTALNAPDVLQSLADEMLRVQEPKSTTISAAALDESTRALHVRVEDDPPVALWLERAAFGLVDTAGPRLPGMTRLLDVTCPRCGGGAVQIQYGMIIPDETDPAYEIGPQGGCCVDLERSHICADCYLQFGLCAPDARES